MNEDRLHEEFWRQKYREEQTPWDLGGISPAVRTLLSHYLPPRGRVLVPGCGRGHEALLLARLGYAVTAVDLVPEPLAELRAAAEGRGLRVDVRQADALALDGADAGAYDTVLEHLFLCALDPALWPRYEAMAHRVLRPGGAVLAALMVLSRGGGPPFSLPVETVRGLFPAERWQVGPPQWQPRNPRRPGSEYLLRLEKR